MRSAGDGRGPDSNGPGPVAVTIDGTPLNPEHWWNLK